MKKALFLLTIIAMAVTPLLTACSENDEDTTTDEFANWRNRNEAYFADVRSNALHQIAQAKNAYGDNWEENCDWRTFLSYSLSAAALTNTAEDSICVQIMKRGTGSGCPLGSDKVRVFYCGRLMPTSQHPDGKMFDHSGQSGLTDKIFDHTTAVPVVFNVTDITRGFATAIQHMHIGDRWRIFVPAKLAYGKEERTGVPAYSTLIFDVELVQYARNGATLPAWN